LAKIVGFDVEPVTLSSRIRGGEVAAVPQLPRQRVERDRDARVVESWQVRGRGSSASSSRLARRRSNFLEPAAALEEDEKYGEREELGAEAEADEPSPAADQRR
jgi:hypothetical protein